MRAVAFILVLLAGLAHTTGAFAHASLVRAEPADGAMLAQPPDVLKLVFNEPVTPLVMRLIGPSGEAIAPAATAENNIITLTPPRLPQGTHVLSWRVVSADGHPVGGSVIFSIGAATQPVSVPSGAGDPVVRAALWAAKIAIYVGLFIGVGGAFFWAWCGWVGARPVMSPALICVGLIVTPISVGLQGLDALNQPLTGFAQTAVWQAGFETAYGFTAVAAVYALLVGGLAWIARSQTFARVLSLLGLIGVGLALSLSGHAGTVEPRWLTRSAVFLHGLCVAFWIGALAPLAVALRSDAARAPLARFSCLVPYPLAVLVVTGIALAIVQLDRLDALWTTRYGLVLSGKLIAVAALLAFAVANRYVFAPKVFAGKEEAPGAVRALARSIKVELVIALAILALVALWRFTPPPRALAAATHVSVHIHGEKAMAQVEIEPVRARGAKVNVLLLDGELRPLAAKELTLVFSNPAAGIEPVRREAVDAGDANWVIDDLRIPVAGRWRLRVEILISDFEKVVLDDQVELPRAP